MFLDKKLYILSIVYIGIIAVILNYVYPEFEITSLKIVIASTGFAFAFATTWIIRYMSKKEGITDENEK